MTSCFVNLTSCLFDELSIRLVVYLTSCLFDELSIWQVVYLASCLFDELPSRRVYFSRLLAVEKKLSKDFFPVMTGLDYSREKINILMKLQSDLVFPSFRGDLVLCHSLSWLQVELSRSSRMSGDVWHVNFDLMA